MAGGIGSRFWPMSRKERPKQFLSVVSTDTLIQNTVARLIGVIPIENCHVVTHARYVEQTQEQLPAILPENIFAEDFRLSSTRNINKCTRNIGGFI